MTSNDNQQTHRNTITVERWDDPGDLNGCYLVSLLQSGTPEPIDARVCGSRNEAFDYARQIMQVYPNALFDDQSAERST